MTINADEGRRLIELKAAREGSRILEILVAYSTAATPRAAATEVAQELRAYADRIERAGRWGIGHKLFGKADTSTDRDLEAGQA
jgi:hypothetical protein